MNKWKLIFHAVGLGLVGTAIAFQLSVLLLIWFSGAFVGVENNRVILAVEIVFTIFAVMYFVFVLAKIEENRQKAQKLNI